MGLAGRPILPDPSRLRRDIGEILAELAAAQQPRPPRFEATALHHIWLGRRLDGGPAILKRSRTDREARAYRELLGPQALPAPTLYHVAPDLGGQGCWLLLEAVAITPPGLSPRSATHWWQNPLRRDRAMVMLAALHARFWNRPEALADCGWLTRYGHEDFWNALEVIQTPPAGWTPLSQGYLGQLASAADMLTAGPSTLVHGSFHPNNVGFREDTPVLLDWETVAWAPPVVDLGRLLTRYELVDGQPALLAPPAWRPALLEVYRTTVEAATDETLDALHLAVAVRGAMLWELAVDLWTQVRRGPEADREAYERTLRLAEELADEP